MVLHTVQRRLNAALLLCKTQKEILEMDKKSGGSRAVISVCGCLLVQICVGIIYLWSVLKGSVAETLGMDTGAAGMVASYMLMAFVLGGLFGGILDDRKGAKLTCILGVCLFSAGIGLTALVSSSSSWLIYLSYAGLGGLGSGFAYSACISCIQKWMPTRRGLASGLAVAAFGLSTVVFAPVFKALMTHFTVDGLLSFKPFFGTLCGIFLLLGLIGCAMITPPPMPEESGANGGASLTLSQALRTRSFIYIFLTVFFINGAWNLATPLLYDLGVARGLTPALATLAVSMTGIASAAGRLIMAALSDKLGRRPSICILSVMTIVASILMIVVSGNAYFAAVSLLAFAYGGPSSVNAAITADAFGPRHSGSIYGVVLLALGGSSLVFNAISANLLGGNVTSTFIMAALSAVVPLLMMFLLKRESAKAEKG